MILLEQRHPDCRADKVARENNELDRADCSSQRGLGAWPKRLGLLVAGVFGLGLLGPPVAWAGAPDELVGLFIQGCMPFVGNALALRAWARRIGLPEVPEQARLAFLHGVPGQVFDATADGAKLVLVSSDDGLCSAVTDQATETQVADALEAGFHKAGLAYRLVIERDDSHINAIHDREYLASRNRQGWRVLSATVKGDQGGEAMLTGAPE